MKVRNKHNREMIVDLGEQWEPESSGIEEVWRDVTKDCDLVSSEDDIIHESRVVMKHLGYRLRKVTLYAMARPIIDPMQREVAAFIVEQKVKS